ncbi:MAG TPA: NAD(P)H-binding protein [Solirubrobacteraceae bacterium]|nr:NAD(P)H-binding protein [Solirubrobacteraceae bacterium]
MRIFVAGASGVLGLPLTALLVAAGHEVARMTRSPGKLAALEALGATSVLCDVYDAAALRAALVEFAPAAVIDQLTDLPDDATKIPELSARADRILHEGTRNLLDAAAVAHADRFVAQSIAWELPGERGVTYREHEQAVLDAGGVVIRYGQLYGPNTYYETAKPDPPRIHVDEAARRTVPALEAPSGIVAIVE